MRVQRLSLSDGTFGFVFAASIASYWLATEPHPILTCDAAPAPFESTVLYSGWCRTSSPVIESFAVATLPGGGIRKSARVRVALPSA